MSEQHGAMDEGPGQGWPAHAQAQLERWRALTYRQRLEWLWQAKRFAARATGAARRPPSEPPGRSA